MTEHQADPTPVVLLHGWGGTYQTTWSGSVLERRLRAAGRTVARLDLPGHGPGPVSHEPKDYELIASQLAMILPHAVVMDGAGFSLGGKLLLQLAADHPGRFRRLVIGGVGANLFRPENGEAVSKALLEGLAPDAPPVLRSVIEEARASGNDPLGLSAVIRRPPRTVTPEDLRAIRAAVLLVVGTDDGIAGPLGPLAETLPSARTAVVEGLDHTSIPSSPEFQDLALAFLCPSSITTPGESE